MALKMFTFSAAKDVVCLGPIDLPLAYQQFMLEELALHEKGRESKFENCYRVPFSNPWRQYHLHQLEEGPVATDFDVANKLDSRGMDHAGLLVKRNWVSIRKPRIDKLFEAQMAQYCSGKQSQILMSLVQTHVHTDSFEDYYDTTIIVPMVVDKRQSLIVEGKSHELKPMHAYAFNMKKPHALKLDGEERLDSPLAAMLSIGFVKE